ncbi:hypothetical protein D0Z00_000775 [Geotrichum galactomycetum]|uniref:Uncharacterized protein n=1 Tax=Geotrichum galactomycetum TaxID=27317 RepID=A0ACB6V8Y9_9ASCO|nr:hypothetical protein D0Z00_000775 [Geotrichum candidum]
MSESNIEASLTESTVFVSDTASVRSLESTAPVEPETQTEEKLEEQTETPQPTLKNKTVAIIGAGLVGCLAALAFERKGYKVKVYEGRPDARTPEQRKIFSFRSINMAVSSRGILALETVDKAMADRVLKNLIPMRARMVHDLAGNEISQNYGLYGEAINSIDRADLNCGLLDELDASANIETFFNHKLVRATFKPSVKLTFSVTQPMENDKFSNILEVDDVDLLVGCDGAHSVVRSQLQKYVRMDLNQEYIDHAYMELRINRIHDDLNEENKFKMDKNHLHIWPRGSHMLIALPNTDGSFTSTLFAPWKIVEGLDTDEKVLDFFWRDFPDVFEKGLMTKEDILKAFHENPRGSLICIKCSPYHFEDKCIIIGDAAHSMVPFYGQGMNCGFEDVRILMELLEKRDFNDIKGSFDEYTETRHKDLTAIIDLAMRNYVEMRESVVSTSYKMRKKLDGILSKTLKDYWLPLYTMVSFRPDISYSEAVRRERLQANIVRNIVTGVTGLFFATGVVTAFNIAHKLKLLPSVFGRCCK